MISKKQKQVFDYIVSSTKKEGFPPTLEEIAGHFDFLKYPSSAHYHVKKLQEQGFLEKETNKPRSIGLYSNKEIMSPFLSEFGLDAVRIPVVGSANCGPAELVADENIEGYIKISKRIVSNKAGVFALRAEGDSMNNANINGKNIEEGDFVLIDSENKTARSGDYVLSVIEGCANLKKFDVDKKTGDIQLISESDNKTHKPIFISRDDNFMINGIIIEVIKR